MITIEKTEEVTEIVKRTFYKLECDICGLTNTDPSWYMGDVVWCERDYKEKHTGIYLINGFNYPSDRSWDCESYHICPNCMQKKIFPFIEGLINKKPHQTNDWKKI